MESGDLAPVIPAGILIVVASLLALAGRLIPTRYRGILMTIAGVGATITIPFLDRAPGGRAFWPWGPPTLFGGPLAFGLSGLAAPFVVAVCLLNLAGTLAAWHDDELQPSRKLRASRRTLGLSAAALLFLLAANWLTLVVAAILFDAVLCLWLARRRPASGVVERFLLPTSIGDLALIATVYLSRLYPAEERLWPIPPVLSLNGVGVGEGSASLPFVAGGLLALAALLRLGAYPLDGWLRPGGPVSDADEGIGSDPGDRLALLVARSLGVYLWLLATAQGIIPGPWGGLILLIAVLGMSLTAILTWHAERYREGVAYLTSFLVSQVVLTAPLMGQSGQGVILVLGGNLLLGIAILSLGPISVARIRAGGRSLFLSLPVVLAAASLIGLPLTLGFIGRVALYRLALSDGSVLLIFVMLFSEVLVFSALWRWLRSDDSSGGQAEAGRLFPSLLRPVAACSLGLLLLLFGVSPPLLERLVGEGSDIALPNLAHTLQALDLPLTLTLLLPFPLAYWLERRHVFARSVAGEARRMVEVALRLEWAERTLADLLGRAGKVLMLLWNVVEGEHYLGWGLVLALGALLFWASQ
jgi:formate hydrogenlyase subunit 3/multisubunit Na+/H+ antiporter MnhD subunit